jgi:hypothetical protein
MMKLAKKTITAETKTGSHKAVNGIILLFYSLRHPNVNGVRAGLAIVVASPCDAPASSKPRVLDGAQRPGYSVWHGKLDSVRPNSPACQA